MAESLSGAIVRAGEDPSAVVLVDRRGAELRILLNRPDRANAWTRNLGVELLAALEVAADDPAVRVVVLSGVGQAFSAGADLKAGFELSPAGTPDVATVLRDVYNPVILALRKLPKPVVAAVNGPAVGIGCSLALACDLVVLRESAYLALGFSNVGLVSDGGASLFVPLRVGAARAAEMALLGRRISSETALEWGLVNRVAPDDRFDAEVDELTGELASGSRVAHAGIKRALNAVLYPRLDVVLELETQLQQDAVLSSDFTEAVAAFRSRRAPRRAGDAPR